MSPIRTYLLLRGQRKEGARGGGLFLLGFHVRLCGVGAEQLTKEATVLSRGLPNSV